MDKDTLARKAEKTTVAGQQEEIYGDRGLEGKDAKEQAKNQVQGIVGAVKRMREEVADGACEGEQAAKRNE